MHFFYVKEVTRKHGRPNPKGKETGCFPNLGEETVVSRGVSRELDVRFSQTMSLFHYETEIVDDVMK